MRLRLTTAIAFALLIGLVAAQDKKVALPGAKSKLPAEKGYERRVIEGFQVLINKTILDQPLDSFAITPFEVLEDELKSINKLIIPKIVKDLQKVQIWVEWDQGEKKANGMRTIAVYHAGSLAAYLQQNKVDPKKANQIEVIALKFLTELKQPGRDMKKVVLLHELVHAVHDKIIGRETPEIVAAYNQAKERKLYENVEHSNGPRRDAYANTNHVEYFAEITCMFLDRVDYFPYDHDGLKNHDPEGFKVAEKVWGKVVKPEPKAKAIASTPPPAKTAPKTEPAPKTEVDAERAAAGKLTLIRELVKDGKKDKARERLTDLIKAYPGTKAAAEAEKLLADLK